MYIHSRAGDLAAKNNEAFSNIIVSEVIENIALVNRELREKRREFVLRDEKLSITREEIKKVAAAHRINGLKSADIRMPLPHKGLVSRICVLDTKPRSVIRKSNWDYEGTVWEKELFEYLLQEDPAMEIARIIPDNEGNPFYRGQNSEDIFVMYEFIRGKSVDAQSLTPGMTAHAQAFLAKLHVLTTDGKFVPDKGKRKVDSIIGPGILKNNTIFI